MIPSTPRLSTPLRWPIVSPSPASRNGVATAIPDATVVVRTAKVKNSFIRRPHPLPPRADRDVAGGPPYRPGAGHGVRPGASSPAHVSSETTRTTTIPLSAVTRSDGTPVATCSAEPPTMRPPKKNAEKIVHSGFRPPKGATTMPLNPAEPVNPVGCHPPPSGAAGCRTPGSRLPDRSTPRSMSSLRRSFA